MADGKKADGKKSNGKNGINSVVQQQLAATSAVESAVLDNLKRTVDRWCERRKQTTEALEEFSQSLLAARGPADFIDAWTSWSTGSVERFLEDTRDQLDMAHDVSRTLTSRSLSAIPAAQTGLSTSLWPINVWNASNHATEEPH